VCVCVHAFIVLAQGLVCVQEEHRTGRLVVDARGFSLSVAAACIRQSSVCGVPALPVTTNRDSDFVLGWPIGRLADFGHRLILL